MLHRDKNIKIKVDLDSENDLAPHSKNWDLSKCQINFLCDIIVYMEQTGSK